MSELNKSYRIKTKIGANDDNNFIRIDENLVQEYDTFEILSVKIKSQDAYRLHNSSNGIIVGRVLANNGFGIPNAKISIFISVENGTDREITSLYPYTSTVSKNFEGVRYNLLPNEQVDGCHQKVGTFPSKRYALDNDVILEVFEKYYKFTTKTNNAGDYLICGVPVGAHTLHMDLDLSDCGILSQKPRDFVYKGYNIEQFETPTKFKGGTDYGSLSQIFTQDQVVNVKPFWGNESLGEEIGITRADIDVNFKFEPTCVFMGSIISDNSSNGFSRKCIPTDHMGDMDELVTGEGRIEMIRKTPGGNIEEIQIKGNKLINADGVWCYQIPMNLDYMITDEYGNMVPTDNPEIGIPTRASVRFRISMEDHEENTENFFRAKVLVPNNPQNKYPSGHESYDYEFGTYTKDESFRDLFWNNVYSVKSFIPRIQKNKNPKNEKFSGIKHCQNFGPNNPMPYNNIRIKLPLMFTIMCALIKAFIFIVSIINTINVWMFDLIAFITNNVSIIPVDARAQMARKLCKMRLIVLKDGLCPDLENWYFAPCNANGPRFTVTGWTDRQEIKHAFKDECLNGINAGLSFEQPEGHIITHCSDIDDSANGVFYNSPKLYWTINLLKQTLASIDDGEFEEDDDVSIDSTNNEEDNETVCITKETDYLISCIEMNLAQEYKVINFDFYNDWINGTIYIPRWVRYVKKVRFLWINWTKERVRGCMDDRKIFSKSRKYTQQCSIGYDEEYINNYRLINNVEAPELDSAIKRIKANNLHKRRGIKQQKIFGKNGGICHQSTTMKGQYVYYLKPCEWVGDNDRKVNLFATDIILIGSFNDCDLNGIPQTFTHLSSSTYIMPTNLALTNMDTNGALYATDNGTICLSSTLNSVSGVVEDNITKIDGGSLSHRKEIDFYGDAENYSLKENGEYADGIDLDTIALTEAAGISWNYTGPGQGEIDEERMYYPGGHFIGLSCVNAQTNLKSCINLSRICEIGSTMSQRRDSVRSVENGILRYTYTAPSGFISGDEIVDTDFRSMFATLNKKRLIATKRNLKTGYKIYDFDFSMPINFNGSFSSMAGLNTPYNAKIEPVEEDLTIFGINLGSTRADFDPEETGNTQIRTREFTSLDYYLFRFGLTYDQINNINFQKKRFLRNIGDTSSEDKFTLPQYENSFYFYFGLKFGSTAIDEFNKQFYSECDNLMIKKTPNMILIPEVNFCENFGKIHVITQGLETPYQSITIYGRGQSEPIYVIDGSREEHRQCLLYEYFTLIREKNNGTITDEFEFDDYTVTLIDANGIEITKQISLGINLITYESTVIDFNAPVPSGGYAINGQGYAATKTIFRGGYIEISNLNIEGYELSDFNFIKLRLVYNGVVYDEVTYTGGTVYLYAANTGIQYSLVLVYKCNGNFSTNEMILSYVTFYDNSELQLKLGNQNVSFDLIGNDGLMMLMKKGDSGWWWGEERLNIGGNDHASSPDDNAKWFFKAMMFNRNKIKTTFNSNVFAVGGRKVLWGTPQSLYGFANNITACSETPTTIEPGYTLDDRYSYYSTYGTDNCNFIPYEMPVQEEESERGGGNSGVAKSGGRPEDYSNCIMHYCAQVYKENKACGKWHGKYDNGVIVFTADDRKYYNNGYGCIFKPLPTGRLRFMIFRENVTEMLEELQSFNCDYGIFYPTFIYPVIKRPFYVVSDYIKNSSIELRRVSNNDYEISPFEEGYAMFADLNNGVTFNKKYNSVSRITGKPDDFFGSLVANGYDGYGITENTNTNRKTSISGLTRNRLETQDITYLIKEGYPTFRPEYEEFTKYHELNINPGFAPYLGYSTIMSGGTNYIDWVGPVGDNNEEIRYYAGILDISDKTKKLDFIYEKPWSEDNSYVYLCTSPSYNPVKTYYALCRFIGGDGYQISINESTIYNNVVVRFIISSTNGNGNVNVKFNYTDINGDEQTFSQNLAIQYSGGGLGGPDILQILRLLNYRPYNPEGGVGGGMSGTLHGYNLPLSPVKMRYMREIPRFRGNVGGSFHNITWLEAVMKLGSMLHQASYYDTHKNVAVPSYNNDYSILVGLGYYKHVEEGNETEVFKVYKELIKLNDEYEPWGDGNGEIYVELPPMPLTAAHQDFEIVYSASSPTILEIDLNGCDWITVNGSTTIPVTGNTSYLLNCTAKYNKTDERTVDINFISNNNQNQHPVTITQAKVTDLPKLQITINKATRVVQSININGSIYQVFDVSIWAQFRYTRNGMVWENNIPEEDGMFVLGYVIHKTGFEEEGQGYYPVNYDIEGNIKITHDSIANASNGRIYLASFGGPETDGTCEHIEVVGEWTNSAYTNLPYKIVIINQANS